MVRRVIGACFVASLGACSLFPSLDEYEATSSQDADAQASELDSGLVSDASSVGADVACKMAGAVCESFESLPGSPWSTTGSALSVTSGVTPAPPSGKALFASTSGDAYLEYGIAPTSSGAFAVRARLLVPKAPSDYADLLTVRFQGDAKALVRLEKEPTWAFQSEGETQRVGATLGVWTCVEMDVLVGASAKVHSFVDGAPLKEVSYASTSAYETIRVGAINVHSTQTFDAYTDDLVYAPFASLTSLPSTPLIGCN